MLRHAAFACLLALPATSLAHINLTYPSQRLPPNSPALQRPCGLQPDPAPGARTPLLPGATIEVRWTEFISHPGHFRISFDDNGSDDFTVPESYTDFYNGPFVLLDNIAPADNVTQHSASIVLPNIECANCTLQVIQVLTDKPPYTSDTLSDDVHYHCADIVLTPTANDVFANGFETPL